MLSVSADYVLGSLHLNLPNNPPKQAVASDPTRARDAAHLDEGLGRFMARGLEEEYPYVILNARYEKVR